MYPLVQFKGIRNNATFEKDYDEIWCVFDMDVKRSKKKYADFDNAITSGQSKGYKITYSNDAFV